MYYILFYKVIANYTIERLAYRDEHLALAQKYQKSGHLILAGALAEPADGAILIFKCETDQVAKDFAENDPYVRNGLITEWKIRPWTVVIGNV